MTVSFEKVQIISQLFQAMEDAAMKMEEAYNQKDSEKFRLAKKAILEFQKQIKEEFENG